MTKLEELIKELCPNGVEYKFVGDVCDTITDYVAAGSFAEIAKKVKYINMPEYALLVRTTDLKSNFVKGDFIYIDKEAYDFLWRVHLDAETIILPNIGNCGEVYYITKDRLPYPHCALAPNAIMVRSSTCLNRYLKYVFESEYFQKQLIKIVSPTGQTKFNKTDLKRLLIPLPPLAVQREVVRILDKFTLLSQELEDKLAAELAARRVQYEYYRDKLLLFNDTIECYQLSKLAKFSYGYTDKAKDSGNVRFIRITDINEVGRLCPDGAKYIDLTEDNKKYLLKKGDLLLARTGATYGRTLYVPDDSPAIYASFLIKINLDNSKILNRYYWHFSKSRLYWQQAEKLVSVGGQQQFNTNAVGRIIVPVPSLDVQERIVKVLDNFDAICSDLGIGLPAEIDKRQQQYEYYRDRLLQLEIRN